MYEDVFIISGARTPMGGLQGNLSQASAVELGATAIKEAVGRAGIGAQHIDEVVMGNVLSAGLKQGPARQAALGAGLLPATGCVTLNKLCGSGMQATIYAHDQIRVHTHSIMVSGGMESMSNAPFIIENARAGLRMGHKQLQDHMLLDGLEDATTGRMMGSFAQETADEHNLTRAAMDEFALTSLARAQKAIAEGLLDDEIVPVSIATRKGEQIVTDDEQPGNAMPEKIPKLRPAFSKNGTVTAANSSSISDGASALVLMSASAVTEHGAKPMAKIIAHSCQSQEPAKFTTAPIGAISKLLEKTGWQKDSVDLWEINEAFAMVTMLAMQELDIPHSKVNVHGGACAVGHPVGSTGSRIIVSLMYQLQRYKKKRGVAALCIGGGEATAIAIEMC